MPESPASTRPSGRSLVLTGAVAATTAAIIGLSAGAADAAVASAPAPGTATDLSAMTTSGVPLSASGGPALDFSGQALTGPSPLDPGAGQPVQTGTASHSVRPAQPAVMNQPVRTHPGALATASPRTHARHHAHGRRHRGPYEIFDSVTPTAIPRGMNVATYATGPFAASAAQVAGRHRVLWIDVNGSDSHASALDVEPGDASPSSAASWAWRKLHADPAGTAIIYTMRSEWPATQAAVHQLPHWMQARVRWWIADPTGVRHLVPGSNATQWYWGKNYDISMVEPGF